MENDNEAGQPKEPHPDKILDEVADILNRMRVTTDAQGILTAMAPYVSLANFMRSQFKLGGFSDEAAEHMIMVVWLRLFEDRGGWDFDGDED